METNKKNLPIPKEKDFVPAPMLETKWINTPFAYARLSKNTTLFQQNVMMKVSEKLQDYMKTFFAEKRHLLPDDPNSLFGTILTLPRIELELSEFGLDRTRNREIETAVEDIAHTLIKAPNIMDDGTVNGYRVYALFDEVTVPKSAGGEYKLGTIYIGINPKVAAYAFNMRLGYINHPLTIASDASQKFAPLLYFIIKHYLPKGKTSVTIPYQKLRDELGMKKVDKETGEYTGEEYYPQYSRFKVNVLDAVQADLNRLAGLNLIDLTFDYVPVYRRLKTGNPEAITFDVHLTDLGKPQKMRRTRATLTAKRAETQAADGQTTLDFDRVGEQTPDERIRAAIALVDSFDINWNIEMGRVKDYRDEFIRYATGTHPDTAATIRRMLQGMAEQINGKHGGDGAIQYMQTVVRREKDGIFKTAVTKAQYNGYIKRNT